MLVTDADLSLRLTIADGPPAARDGAAAVEDRQLAEPWTDPTGEEHGYGREQGSDYQIYLYGIGSFTFATQSGLVRGVREPGVAPELIEEVFHRKILPFVLQRQGWEVLHASGLVVAGVGIALCGDSEAGKSTLAYAWRRRGEAIYADDAVPFRIEGGVVRPRPIPFRLSLRPLTVRYLGLAAEEEGLPVDPQRVATSAPGGLGAIYLLEQRRSAAAGPTRVEPVAPEHALPALLKQAFCLTLRDPCRNYRMIETYVALMNRVPIFRLSYPTGLDHVDEILDRLAGHVASLVASGRADAEGRKGG